MDKYSEIQEQRISISARELEDATPRVSGNAKVSNGNATENS